MKGYWAEIAESFRQSHGPSFSLVSLVIALGTWFGLSDVKVGLKWVVPSVLIVVVMLMIFINLSSRAFSKARSGLPKVKASFAPSSHQQTAVAGLLLERSELFGHESLISVFMKENDFERLIGYGFVTTIQENGLIQVLVTGSLVDEEDDVWKLVANQNVDTLKKLMVKATVPKLLLSNQLS
ncbi:MAG: hypothetical protein RIE53_10285 [Rhodothermales bacterium]